MRAASCLREQAYAVSWWYMSTAVSLPAEAKRHIGSHGGHQDLVVRILEDKGHLALHARTACAGRQQAAQDAQQRGLAAAVGPQQDVQLAGLYSQIHVAQHLCVRA